MSFVAAAVVFAWASVASAQGWAAAGATGAVDESGRSMYVFGSNGAVAIRSSVTRGTLTLRYPVQSLPFEFTPTGDCTELRVLLRDTGSGARVIVRVMQLGIDGEATIGELTSIAEIDSDRMPASGDPNQYRRYHACLTHGVSSGGGDYLNYVDVQLIKTTATANPGLMFLKICPSQDFCDP
jgi:hypothetical protein